MTTVNDIYSYLCELAPIETAMDFDNCGILVGSGDMPVTKAFMALDITGEVVRFAAELNAELIISHHPVIFEPLKRLERGSVPYMLAQNNIAAICMHTNLDRAEKYGVNISLAKALGLKNIEFDKENCVAYGDIQETTAKDFALKVKTALYCDGVRYTDCGKILRRAAVSSGAGGSNVFLAADKADVFVTGEIKHHELIYAAEKGLSIVDAGHRRTEEIVFEPLFDLLTEKFGDEVSFIQDSCDNDGIEYI